MYQPKQPFQPATYEIEIQKEKFLLYINHHEHFASTVSFRGNGVSLREQSITYKHYVGKNAIKSFQYTNIFRYRELNNIVVRKLAMFVEQAVLKSADRESMLELVFKWLKKEFVQVKIDEIISLEERNSA